MSDLIREPRPEPTEDQELDAVKKYLEELPPKLFSSRNSLLASLRQLFQTPSQRFHKEIDSAASETPVLMLHAAQLSSIASQQTLSGFKDDLEFECDRQMATYSKSCK